MVHCVYVSPMYLLDKHSLQHAVESIKEWKMSDKASGLFNCCWKSCSCPSSHAILLLFLLSIAKRLFFDPGGLGSALSFSLGPGGNWP